MPDPVYIVKEGWLLKRGQYIKNWRPRYFRLLSDGSFLGYRDKQNISNGAEPLNDFSIRRCQIMKTNNKQKNYSFIIRCFQLTVIVERLFAVDADSEREGWINSIESTSKKVAADLKFRQKGKFTSQYSHYKPEMTLSCFEFLNTLGKGTFGTVKMVKEITTGKIYAMKLLKKELIIEKGEVEHTLTENRVLQTLKNPFLTELKYSFQTSDALVFVMECVKGGELFHHLSRDKVFTESRARFYSAEIILALKHLHENKIIYRDMKLENILLDEEGHIKITDFGLCKEEITFTNTTSTFCGTPEYLAPEVLEDSEYGLAVDWWGFGVVLYEMLIGRLPFSSKTRDHEELFELILKEPVKYPPTLSTTSISILNGLLEKNPRRRLGAGVRDAEEVMAHEFFELIVWDDIFRKRITPPFKPILLGETDVSNFSDEFTNIDPRLSFSTSQEVQLDPVGSGPTVCQKRGSNKKRNYVLVRLNLQR